MPAIPDTIRRLIISFSCYYDDIVVGAPKNRYNGEHGSRDPAYYVCAEEGMHSNDIASCSRERDIALVTLCYCTFERYSRRCSSKHDDSVQILLFNSPPSN